MRTLRGIERAMVALGPVMGPDLVVGIVRGELPPRVLRAAVDRLQQRYAALRTRVDGDRLVVDGRPIAVDVVSGDWRTHAEAELSRPLRLEAGESARVIFAPASGAILLSVHHALVDGVSLAVLLAALLTDCAALLDGRFTDFDEVPLAPAVLDAVPGRWWEPAAGVVGALGAPLVVAAEQRALLAEGAVEGPMRSVSAFADGTPAGMRRLTAACRAHGVTVGAALMAATSFAVGRLRAERGGALAPVGVDVQIDLRRRADLPPDRVGFHTSAARVDAPPADVDFWSLARRMKSEVERDIAWGLPRLAHEVGDRLDWTPRDLPGVWASVSNVGRFPHGERFGALTLDAVYGLNGAVPGGPAAMVFARSLGGRLCLSAVGSHPTVDANAIRRVLRDVRELVERPAALRLDAWAPVVRAA